MGTIFLVSYFHYSWWNLPWWNADSRSDSSVGDRLYLSSSWDCILIASFILGVPSLLLEWLFVSPVTLHQTRHCSWQHWEWAKLLGRASLCSVVKVVPLSAQVGCINKCGWQWKARQSLYRQRDCDFKERPWHRVCAGREAVGLQNFPFQSSFSHYFYAARGPFLNALQEQNTIK